MIIYSINVRLIIAEGRFSLIFTSPIIPHTKSVWHERVTREAMLVFLFFGRFHGVQMFQCDELKTMPKPAAISPRPKRWDSFCFSKAPTAVDICCAESTTACVHACCILYQCDRKSMKKKKVFSNKFSPGAEI